MGDYRAGVSARVGDVIAREVYTVREDMTFSRDLNVGAIDQFEIACALEAEFGIEISNDDWLAAVNGTVGDVVDLIVRLTQA